MAAELFLPGVPRAVATAALLFAIPVPHVLSAAGVLFAAAAHEAQATIAGVARVVAREIRVSTTHDVGRVLAFERDGFFDGRGDSLVSRRRIVGPYSRPKGQTQNRGKQLEGLHRRFPLQTNVLETGTVFVIGDIELFAAVTGIPMCV
jgi:hypothetical protein